MVFVEKQNLETPEFLECALNVVLVELLADLAAMPYGIEFDLDDWVVKKAILANHILTESLNFSVSLSRKI